MRSIQSIYGEVDNLKGFVHPTFNKTFEFLKDKDVIALADKVVDNVSKSGYRQVVVSESGTAPFIYVCKEIALKKNLDINWFYFKTPRDKDINLFEMLMYYLNEDEQNEVLENDVSRKQALFELCKDLNILEHLSDEKFTVYDSISEVSKPNNKPYCQKFRTVIKGTKIYEIFNNQFIFFDEYINAGTILRNFKFYFDLFSEKPLFKLGSYCIFAHNPEQYKEIAFTLYNKDSELECYLKGAYPFENRIDLIGYFYFIDSINYKKIDIESLKIDFISSTENLQEFIENLKQAVEESGILNILKKNCQEKQVSDYIKSEDVIRYIFKMTEEKYFGKSKYSDFLDQLFELYAPIWSPMPICFHLDYWNAFELTKEKLEKIAQLFKKDYIKNRASIFNQAIDGCIKRRKDWLININKVLGGSENENN